MSEEFRARYSGRYYGKYRAVVVDPTGDPNKLGRIKVQCPSVTGDEVLGWAFPSPSAGGGWGTGDLALPLKGDFVWLEFEEGDVSRPVWSAGPWGMKLGRSMVPKHSRGAPDSTDYARRDYGIVPPSQYQGSYGHARFIGAPDGSFLELDSTPGAGRVQLSHFTGTRLEYQSDGSAQEVVTQAKRCHIGEASLVEIVGKEEKTIGGNQDVKVDGAATRRIKNAFTSECAERTDTMESLQQNVSSSAAFFVGGTWTQQIMSQANVQVGGQYALTCGQNVLISAAENLEIVGMNANGLASIPLMEDALILHGYNGNTVVKATSADGIRYDASLVLEGNSGNIDLETKLAGVPGGSIRLLPNTVGANVLLGGRAAIQPVVLGDSLHALLTQLLANLMQFFTAASADPVARGVATAASAAITTLSVILGTNNSRSYLSQTVRTK